MFFKVHLKTLYYESCTDLNISNVSPYGIDVSRACSKTMSKGIYRV